MYSADDIATLVIIWCNLYNIPITNLKLQKLLYFIQGEYARRTSRRLIEEDFYAWQLGPVIPALYSKYALYSSTPIPRRVCPVKTSIPPNVLRIIENILAKYAHRATWDLVNLSHCQAPWKYNYQIFGNRSIIPYRDIEKYFREDRN